MKENNRLPVRNIHAFALCTIVTLIIITGLVGVVSGHTVNLISPENNTITNLNNNSLQFIYNHTGSLTGVVNCILYLDGNSVNYSMDVAANTNQSVYSNQSWNEGTHYWYVNCTNGTDTESSLDIGQNYTFTADFTPPNITSWYTNATNASSPHDLMFLVSANDSIFFNITVENPDNDTSYMWFVNKTDQNNNASNFTFDVPDCDHQSDPSSCIWEIHVIANDSAGNEAHHEWVISTLNESEAPDFFEYFTDKKAQGRTDTDPWGRALPEWSGSFSGETSECSIKAGYVDISYPSSITEGTWIFRYKFKYSTDDAEQMDKTGGNIYFYPFYTHGILSYNWGKFWDAHHHCVIESWLHGERTQFSMDYDGAGTYEDGEWHKVVLIRKGNYFYAFKEIKHQSLPESKTGRRES